MIIDVLDRMIDNVGYLMICLNQGESKEFLEVVDSRIIHIDCVLYSYRDTLVTVDREIYEQRAIPAR